MTSQEMNHIHARLRLWSKKKITWSLKVPKHEILPNVHLAYYVKKVRLSRKLVAFGTQVLLQLWRTLTFEFLAAFPLTLGALEHASRL